MSDTHVVIDKIGFVFRQEIYYRPAYNGIPRGSSLREGEAIKKKLFMQSGQAKINIHKQITRIGYCNIALGTR